jgi:anaerobic selenocysteine-containing dehydrogenase
MPFNFNGAMSRRKFLKLSGTATAAAALGRPRILHALVPATQKGSVDQAQELFCACDMCFNKCGLIARDIRRLARELAAAAPSAMVYPGRRSSDYKDSTQIRRSYAIVNASLGNWDQKGGLILPQKIKTGFIATDAPFYEDNPED